jgi:hypothetical protein
MMEYRVRTVRVVETIADAVNDVTKALAKCRGRSWLHSKPSALKSLRQSLEILAQLLRDQKAPSAAAVDDLAERCRNFAIAYESGDKHALDGNKFQEFLDAVERCSKAIQVDAAASAERTAFWK